MPLVSLAPGSILPHGPSLPAGSRIRGPRSAVDLFRMFLRIQGAFRHTPRDGPARHREQGAPGDMTCIEY